MLGLFAMILALDPVGAYWGVPITWQYGVLIGAASIAGWLAVIVKRSVSEGAFLLLSFSVLLMGLAKVGWHVSGISDSAIRVAAIPYVVACGYVAALRPGYGILFVRLAAMGGVWVCLALFAWRLFGFFESFEQLYHEEVFLIAPLMILSASSRVAPVRYLGVGIGCLGLVASNKFTAYVVLVIVSMLIAATFYRSRFWRRRNNVLPTVVLVVFVSMVAVGAIYYLVSSPAAPSGSADVRNYTYAIRWKEFLAEPFFGGAHSPGTAIYVGFKKILIPSHSDTLDILAYCGLFGGALVMVPILRRIHLNLRVFNFAMAGLLIAIVATSMVNPFLYQPAFLSILVCAVYFSKGSANDRSVDV
jgi:hypothetical protein